MTRKSLVVAAVFALLITGCTTTGGTKFNVDSVHNIKEGRTTKAEVISLLGMPINQSKQVDGTEMWIWYYTEVTHAGVLSFYGVADSKNDTKNVIVMFRKDVVTECTYSASIQEGRGIAAAQGLGVGRDAKVKCSELGT